jgi:hypothetical protein
MCIFYQTFNEGVHVHMSLYTLMFSTQFYVYYLIFHNESFMNHLLIIYTKPLTIRQENLKTKPLALIKRW